MSRIRNCGRALVGGVEGVSLMVSRGADGSKAGLGGVQSCGSVWACPVCASKILAGRQAELEHGLATWGARGGRVVLLTLTMRHREGQAASELWNALSYAWGKVTSGRTWTRQQETYGQPVVREVTRGKSKGQTVIEARIPWVRVVEATHGQNGWHLHVHAALLVGAEMTEQRADELGCEMFQVWRDALIRKGLDAPLARHGGMDAKLWNGQTGVLSDYFTKNQYDADSGTAAAELSRGDRKTGRRGNRTPFQVLRDIVVHGLVDDLDLWHEWERASKGRRQMTWSAGLKDELGVVEVEDQVLVDESADGETELILPAETWKVLVRDRTVCDLLEAAEEAPGAAAAWLDRHRLAWRPPT